jgi:hypothetical protein
MNLMSAQRIWRITVLAMTGTVTISLIIVLFLGSDQIEALSGSNLEIAVLVFTGLTVLLRVWSIGLLYRRAFDLYGVSVARWLGFMATRSSDFRDPPGPLALAFVFAAALAFDLGQILALRSAIARTRQVATVPSR